jgi:hypothetical protein
MSARRRESQSTVNYFAAAMHPAISPLAKLTPRAISSSERRRQGATAARLAIASRNQSSDEMQKAPPSMAL